MIAQFPVVAVEQEEPLKRHYNLLRADGRCRWKKGGERDKENDVSPMMSMVGDTGLEPVTSAM